MNRREFFKRGGLGVGGLLLAPVVLGEVWVQGWEAEEACGYVVDTLLRQGMVYVDVRVGICEIRGRATGYERGELLREELMGIRMCGEDGWRHVVVRDFGREGLERQLGLVLGAERGGEREADEWISAHFEVEGVLARKSSHVVSEAELNGAWLRYAERPLLCRDGEDFLFCDLLIEQ